MCVCVCVMVCVHVRACMCVCVCVRERETAMPYSVLWKDMSTNTGAGSSCIHMFGIPEGFSIR